MKRTFNVKFTDPDNGFDETQFDLEDADFATMANELIDLFNDFCLENYGDDPAWMYQIEEIPYDGEDE